MEEKIYQVGDPLNGDLFIIRRDKVRKKFRLSVPSFLVGGILGGLILFSPLIFMEVKYRLGSLTNKSVEILPASKFAAVIRKSDILILRPVDEAFSIIIPKIGVNSRVIANVEPGDKKEFKQALSDGVAHAAGTYFPGENGKVYIFGHSSDFVWNFLNLKADFYLLRELKEGDEFNIFYQGDRYLYKVVDKKSVSATDLEYLRPTSGKEEVVLQTCWPPGANWKRLVVVGEKA